MSKKRVPAVKEGDVSLCCKYIRNLQEVSDYLETALTPLIFSIQENISAGVNAVYEISMTAAETIISPLQTAANFVYYDVGNAAYNAVTAATWALKEPIEEIIAVVKNRVDDEITIIDTIERDGTTHEIDSSDWNEGFPNPYDPLFVPGIGNEHGRIDVGNIVTINGVYWYVDGIEILPCIEYEKITITSGGVVTRGRISSRCNTIQMLNADENGVTGEEPTELQTGSIIIDRVTSRKLADYVVGNATSLYGEGGNFYRRSTHIIYGNWYGKGNITVEDTDDFPGELLTLPCVWYEERRITSIAIIGREITPVVFFTGEKALFPGTFLPHLLAGGILIGFLRGGNSRINLNTLALLSAWLCKKEVTEE